MVSNVPSPSVRKDQSSIIIISKCIKDHGLNEDGWQDSIPMYNFKPPYQILSTIIFDFQKTFLFAENYLYFSYFPWCLRIELTRHRPLIPYPFSVFEKPAIIRTNVTIFCFFSTNNIGRSLSYIRGELLSCFSYFSFVIEAIVQYLSFFHCRVILM